MSNFFSFKRLLILVILTFSVMVPNSSAQIDFNLSNADVRIDGLAVDDNAGYEVARLGDINGDGYSDFAISSKKRTGVVGIFFGKPTGNWPVNITIGNADVFFTGEIAGDGFGDCIAGHGDINGDGIDDMVISAPKNDTAGNDAGKVYVFLGRKSAWISGSSVAIADAILLGEHAGDLAGTAMSFSGDFNKDGIDDLVIGAPGYFNVTESMGKIYLVLGGKYKWSKNMSLGVADAKIGPQGDKDFVLGNPPPEDCPLSHWFFGQTLSFVKDLNKDGCDDLVVGAPGFGYYVGSFSGTVKRFQIGRVYTILGNISKNLIPIEPWLGTLTDVDPQTRHGYSLGGGGDIDGDSYPDFWESFGSMYEGLISVRKGAGSGYSFKYSTKSYYSASVSSLSDVDGDGISDLLMGDKNGSFKGMYSMEGIAFLILGKKGGWGSIFNDINSSIYDVKFSGEKSNDRLGESIELLGDVNGDGQSDLLISAPYHDGVYSNEGRVYLIFGSSLYPPPCTTAPTVSIQTNQTNYLMVSVVQVTVNASSCNGLAGFWWWSENGPDSLKKAHIYSLNGQKQASYVWTFLTPSGGKFRLCARSRDVLYGDTKSEHQSAIAYKDIYVFYKL